MKDDEKDILPAAASPPEEGAGPTPSPAPSPSLSVVMIVKDEEERLGKCLESLEPLGWDQLVVVDTGSTDRTMEIAREFDAEVYEHEVVPWSFAKARNIALGYATGEWILSIDADETLEGPWDRLRNMLSRLQGNIGGAAIVMEDMQGEKVALTWSSVRLIRRDMRPEWKGAYHNMITHKGDLALLEGVRVRHWGYDIDAEAMEAKLVRTEEVILRDMQENGPGEAHRAYFYLAHIASKRSRYEAALKHGRKYVENARKAMQFNPSIYNVLFHCALNIGEYEEADHWLSLAIQDIPNDLDIAYDLVLYGDWVGRPDLIIEGGRKFVGLYDAFENNLAELANRFVYHHCPASKAYVLRKVSAALAGEASGALEQYKRVLVLLDEDEATAEREQAKTDLSQVGTNWINS